MRGEGLPLGVPKGVHKEFVVLDGDRAHRGTQTERPSLEHDRVLVVDARALGKDQQGCGPGVPHGVLHALLYQGPVCGLGAVEPHAVDGRQVRLQAAGRDGAASADFGEVAQDRLRRTIRKG